ncbi:MAG TPA: nuclear transport factor 2 family protein [Mycobacteriales bacterium]|jgi:ketosteroid isomerase-like protein|nr:nuclear transport factor 2 family protein [Mycobacteriales bacterium]
MARSPQEVFAHHGEALGTEDLDAIVSDYAEDAVVMTSEGVVRGRDGIREMFARLLAVVPQAAWDLRTTVFEGDVLFLEWAAAGGGNRIEDGVDTFLFDDGLIRVQTVHLTVQSGGA